MVIIYSATIVTVVASVLVLAAWGVLAWRYQLLAGWPVAFVLMLAATFLVAGVRENEGRNVRYRDGIRQVRELYPFESLDDRLPSSPSPYRPEGDLPAAVRTELNFFEIEIDNASHDRAERLQRLHNGSVEEFVRREGVGSSRMLGGYGESLLANFDRNRTSIPQGRTDHTDVSSEIESQEMPFDRASVLSLHRRNAVHFVNPSGFGFMKDRQNVAGFQDHQFNEIPENKVWRIDRLELIGLLLDERPRVYVTDELPRMGKVRDIPTRAPDAFEMAGLGKLIAGEDLFFREGSAAVRMLGAIRSVKQCVQCHGGERGDLLGAFSYSLTRITDDRKK